MIFRRDHLEAIRSGEKTATRQPSNAKRLSVGEIHRAVAGRGVPRSEGECFVRVTDVYRQRLEEMTDADADREGGYSLAEFREMWREINGEWDPEGRVVVYEFEYAGDTDPRESDIPDSDAENSSREP
ncbi:ASCH domain-containing protein [Halobacteriales archaeon QH_8_64_26]|jgi:hypothetical protein|nr:MAG: ASCH domain-containing protein [Halobacteriales archaeon QH_8_64_26]